MSDLQRELVELLNRNRVENPSDTPDFILADYILACLRAWEKAILARDAWYSPLKCEEEAAPPATDIWNPQTPDNKGTKGDYPADFVEPIPHKATEVPCNGSESGETQDTTSGSKAQHRAAQEDTAGDNNGPSLWDAVKQKAASDDKWDSVVHPRTSVSRDSLPSDEIISAIVEGNLAVQPSMLSDLFDLMVFEGHSRIDAGKKLVDALVAFDG